MIKLSLNAQKARELAKALKVIPHPESDWKWAIRTLRREIPKTENAVEMARSGKYGKKIHEAKIRMGKLPNKELASVRTLSQRVPYDTEVGIDINKKLHVGAEGDSILDVPETIIAHTHPSSSNYYGMRNQLFGVTSNEVTKRNFIKEVSRIRDPVLIASPSGLNHFYKGREAYHRNMRLDPEFGNKITKHDELFNTASKIKNSLLRDVSSAVLQRKQDEIARVGSHTGRWTYMYGSELVPKLKQVVLAKGVEGVHKLSPKHRKGVRSVYFEGGL